MTTYPGTVACGENEFACVHSGYWISYWRIAWAWKTCDQNMFCEKTQKDELFQLPQKNVYEEEKVSDACTEKTKSCGSLNSIFLGSGMFSNIDGIY